MTYKLKTLAFALLSVFRFTIVVHINNKKRTFAAKSIGYELFGQK